MNHATTPQDVAPLTGLATLAQASERYHLHPVTLRDAAREGRIPAYKPGRKWLFDLDELDELFRRDATRALDGALSVTRPQRARGGGG
jgi:excisionase family DNA binding protein